MWPHERRWMVSSRWYCPQPTEWDARGNEALSFSGAEEDLMANVIMRHKAFVGPTAYWNFRSLNDNRELIREQAETFINMIGAENVVSVVEHPTNLGPFTVVVWYRVDGAALNDSLEGSDHAHEASSS